MPVPAAPVGSRSDLGRIGEDAAGDHYGRRGFELLARNWRCSLGELDLVLRRGRVLVFCEVKTRRGSSFGQPFEAVHCLKQRKVRALAQAFLAGRDPGCDIRFDVASVTVDRAGRATVNVFEDAF
ncbi:MAG TPA: YraN family protein [Actinomycetota bacterium]